MSFLTATAVPALSIELSTCSVTALGHSGGATLLTAGA